ncbi:chromosome segregation protein SMC [Peptoniphilus catoniae]|uniref:chromosome segregation protein SMC n=1 Tax=Peptoniphilus catoniae TaxID=1660341 RepID=UPI0010FDA9F3|nr:chromosome segregation protein SMC [Peptoniphilus catoniae]
MYLKSLYIQGFKSFANKTKIEFNNNITGIVGPNGSGKSNISDAIMWVLGESSVKNLRGSKMEDVIFSGSDNKRALSLAEVTMNLDNSDGTLPIKYSEVSVTRRMYRSGETEYLINNIKCRLKDIKELFMDTGIGKDGYSLIGQGKIEKVLSSKPEERRAIFEEAAGISKYKLRKVQTERKLEKTEENIIRLNDIISEIESREKTLKVESDNAKKYKRLFEELKKYEIENTFLQIDQENKKNEKYSKEKESLEIEIEESNGKIRKSREKYEELKKELADVNKSLEDNQSKILEINNNIERANSKENIILTKKENLIKDTESKRQEIEDLEQLLEDRINSNEEIKSNLSEEEKNYSDLSENIKLLEKEFKDKILSLEERENLYQEKNNEILDLHKKKAYIESKLSLKDSLIKDRKERHESVNKNLEILKANNEEITSALETNEKSYKDLTERLTSLKASEEESKVKLSEFYKEFKEIEIEVLNKKEDLDREEARFNALKNISENYEGYNRSVKSFMNLSKSQSLFSKDLIGPVAENIKVSPKFEKAISVALGSSLQNIIINDDKAAKDMIKFLVDRKLGRVTFLPINSIKYKASNVNLAPYKSDGVLGFAEDFVEYDAKIKNIIGYLLARVIITKDFDSGSRISNTFSKAYRVVTLNGDSFNIGGSLTGGYISKQSNEILSRKNQLNEIKDHISKIRFDYENLLSKKTVLEKNLQIESEKKSQIENSYGQVENKLTNLEINLSNLNNSKKSNDAYLLRYTEEINKLEENIAAETSDYIQIKGEVLEIENKLEAYKDNLKDKEDLDLLKEEVEKLRIDSSNLSLEEVKLKSRIDNLKKSLENNLNFNEIDRNKISNLLNLIKENENESGQLLVEYQISAKSRDSISKNLDLIKNLIIDAKNKRSDLENKSEKLVKEIDGLKDELMEREKRFFKLESYFENTEVKINSLKDAVLEKYGVNLDEKTREPIEGSKESIRIKIKELTKAIEDLGSINLFAIEDYEETSNRLKFNLEQKNDLLISRKEILNVLKEMEIEMRDMFKKSFLKISKYFDEIFKILFNGGRAAIEIEGDDILGGGINISVQPPGKKFQSLSLLSGGERALTAVSLLFAILKVKPAPFCILDEIDAALDDANIIRYADYIKDLKDIQFIIITHRKLTMEIANVLYGVTMEEKGISKLISVELKN